MKKIDLNFFPGWTRKSLAFTIDDGNIAMDKKFIDIVKPAGILGTFNLHHLRSLTPEEYREFYRGYEIANHCKQHPLAMTDGQRYEVADEPLDRTTSRDYTPDDPVVYRSDIDGLYYMHHHPERKKPEGWYGVASTDTYISLADESRAELEAVFGAGSVKAFVWPYGKQRNAAVLADLRGKYNSIRRTGCAGDSENYRLPADRFDWTYNANNVILLAEMEKYEAYPDDGELKFFSFGVHSVDFERTGNWDDLVAFADKYGNRPEDYYYASVTDILEYEDAVKSVEITDTAVKNPSDRTLYIKIDGKRYTLAPKSEISV